MMRWFYKLRLRFRSLFRKEHAEKELSDELRFHLEKLSEEKVARGMTKEEARYAALRELGGVEQTKEECRDMRRVNYIESFVQDVRYGLRMLAKNPGFTTVAVIALALGIGANTAIFSVVNTVLLRPLPYKAPERLVMVWEENSKQGYPQDTPAAANYVDWRDQNHVFAAMAAITEISFNLTGIGDPERIDGQRVSASLFPLLGVEPQLGRAFRPEEDKPGANQVVIMSHGLW